MRWMVLLAVGCAYPIPYEVPPAQTPQQFFNARWTGKSQDDVVVHYGEPTNVLPLTNGNHVYSYHSEVAVSQSSGRLVVGVGGRADAVSTTITCDRRFEIEQATLRVSRAVLSGAECDPNK